MCDANEPIVLIQQGTLRGTTQKDMDGEIYYSFKGIPYAKPPLGKLRFKAPEPPIPWTGVLDATKDGAACYSKDLFSKSFTGSEDCLILNVYTPKLDDGNNLMPVMVWIHGGGFTCGSSSLYGPHFLIASKVVVVTLNYRLGALGFLSFKNSSSGIPGNAGFKDMVMALRWVKTNIRYFDGDPDNVTVFGESAGGAAVHLLMMSPMSRGLFHKAIAQSGCALYPWVKGERLLEKLCSVLGCHYLEDQQIIEHLQNISVEELLRAQDQIPYFLDPNKIGPYGLVIEMETSQEPAFMSREPIDAISSGDFMDIPFMVGYTKDEGMVVDTYRPARVANMINDFECNVPHVLGYRIETNKSRTLAGEIKKFYFGNHQPSSSSTRQFYTMATDLLFFYGIYVTAKKQSALSSCPVYLYRMSIETSLKFLKVLIEGESKGAVHGDDVAYLFKSSFTPAIKNRSVEYLSVKKFVKLWTNFAREGNPTPNIDNCVMETIWKPVDKHGINFLDIGLELVPGLNPEPERVAFWDQAYSQSVSGSKFI